MTRVLPGLALAAIAIGGLLAAKLGEPKTEVELATLMLRLQIHMDKLHFSGKAGNQPLTAFYVHEIRETVEEIEQAGITEDGVAVSLLAPRMLEPALKKLDEATKASAGFAKAYSDTVAACNGCHVASKHGFIVIRMPDRPMFDNQVYSPPAR